jgi:hypothetical protein
MKKKKINGIGEDNLRVKALREMREKPKYPHINYDDKKQVKITLKERDDILQLYKSGYSITQIAKAYHVWYTTIKAIVDPEWRNKRIKHKMGYYKEKRKDPLFRKKLHKLKTIWLQERQKKDPKVGEWVRKTHLRLPSYNQKYGIRSEKYKHPESRLQKQKRLDNVKNNRGFRNFIKSTEKIITKQ